MMPQARRWPGRTLLVLFLAAVARPRLVGLGLAGAIALVGLVWGVRPQAASAAVIMARAGQALDDARAFGLQSVSGQVQGRGVDVGTGETGPQPYTYTFHKQIRLLMPGQVRLDECVTPAGMPEQCYLVVSDGTTGWLYLPQRPTVARFATGGLAGITFVAADQRSLLASASEQGHVRLLGTETVAGRPTYLLEITAAPEQVSSIASVRVWIDQEFYIQLRHEARDRQGNLVTAWSYTRFEPNPDLDAAQFRFSPPAGVPVEEGYPFNTNTLYITPELRLVVLQAAVQSTYHEHHTALEIWHGAHKGHG